MNSRKSLTIYFLIAFVFTWLLQVPAILTSHKLLSLSFSANSIIPISTFGPFLAAFLLVSIKSGKQEAWNLLKSGFRLRMPIFILLFVVFVPITATLISTILVGELQSESNIFTIFSTFILFFFFGGSFGEEFGWRGFALPRLLVNYGLYFGTSILGFFWTVWHLPLFLIKGTTQYHTPFWVYFIFVFSYTFIYTWVYLHTKGNIFSCLLLHTFTNLTVVLFPIMLRNGVDGRVYYESFIILAVAIFVFFFKYKKMEFLVKQLSDKESEKHKEMR